MRRFGVIIGILTLPAALLVAASSPTAAAGCTITGTDGDDVLAGTAGRDHICGLGGDDVLRGLGGDDVLVGGDGDDMLVGKQGADRLFGGTGHDSLVPGAGPDTVDGGAGRDNVSYRDVAGGVVVNLAAGTAVGPAAGTDTLTSVLGMTGTPGDDILIGTAEKNYVEALGGADVIRPDDGPDLVNAGGGTDLLDYTGLSHGVYVNLNSGSTFHGGRIRGVEDISGTAFTDVFDGDAGPNTLVGGGEGDGLYGGGGDDVLDGGSGPDYIRTGGGNDAVDGGASEKDAVEFPNEGSPVQVDLDLGTVTRDGVDAPFTGIETVSGTWSGDVLRGGLGAIEVSFYGNGGADDISTVDGYDGDLIYAVSFEPLTCAGDPGDDIECRTVS